MNLCIYFQEHALFLKQSGEFESLSWFIRYNLGSLVIDLDCWALNGSI